MSDQNFFFPSQTGSLYTPAGNFRIKIFYDDGGGASNTDINADIIDISEIDMPFDIAAGSQSMRHASMTIKLHNKVYDSTNNVFEQYAILDNDYASKTYLSVIIDGSELWRGIIDFTQIKKEDYYLDGSNLKYRTVQLKCYEALYYYWINDDDMDDISYSDGQALTAIWDNIFDRIGFSSSYTQYDSNIKIDEPCGNSYNLNALKVQGLASTYLVRDFIMQFIFGFAVFIYNWNSNYRVISRVGSASTYTIQNDDIIDLKKIDNHNPVNHVKVTNDRDWSDDCANVGVYTHEKSWGTSLFATSDFICELEGLLEYIYIDYGTAANHPSPAYPATGGTSSTLEDAVEDPDPDFFDVEIESGMIVDYYTAAGSHQNRNILNVLQTSVSHPDDGSAGKHPTNDYYIERNPDGFDDLFKIELLVQYAANVYYEFFLTSKDILRVQLLDISDFIYLHNRFSILSNNHRIRDAKINIMKDDMTLELARVT